MCIRDSDNSIRSIKKMKNPGFFIFLIDLIELSRRITKSNNSDFLLALELALLKLPGMIIEIFPFIVLFASLSTFFYFAKRSELIVARASGVSIWHLLIPGISLILIIGFFTVILIQPLVATSSYKFKELEAKTCLLYTSPSPRDATLSRMPSSA